MIKFIRGIFKAKLEEKPNQRTDEFIWVLAEALLWRDEEVSPAAIPTPIKQQPLAHQYYDDAKYLVKFVTDRWDILGDQM